MFKHLKDAKKSLTECKKIRNNLKKEAKAKVEPKPKTNENEAKSVKKVDLKKYKRTQKLGIQTKMLLRIKKVNP